MKGSSQRDMSLGPLSLGLVYMQQSINGKTLVHFHFQHPPPPGILGRQGMHMYTKAGGDPMARKDSPRHCPAAAKQSPRAVRLSHKISWLHPRGISYHQASHRVSAQTMTFPRGTENRKEKDKCECSLFSFSQWLFLEVDSGDSQPKRQLTIPVKIVRYLPFIPRIQRLYMTEESVKQMTWHKKRCLIQPWEDGASVRWWIMDPFWWHSSWERWRS